MRLALIGTFNLVLCVGCAEISQPTTRATLSSPENPTAGDTQEKPTRTDRSTHAPIQEYRLGLVRLKAPLCLLKTDNFKDGGSIDATFQDARGATLYIF